MGFSAILHFLASVPSPPILLSNIPTPLRFWQAPVQTLHPPLAWGKQTFFFNMWGEDAFNSSLLTFSSDFNPVDW